MAYYAELKRRKWYCINRMNMINMYNKYLYDEWHNSLTEEQKQRLEERRKAEEREVIYKLAHIFGFYGAKIPDKYGDIYDEFGFSKKR